MDFSVPKELVHILLVSFPGQGHINPLLRLGTLLASKGVLVTFSTTESAGKKIRKVNKHIDELTPVGDGIIRFEFFDDGLRGEDDPRFQNLDVYLPQLELLGTKALTSIIKKHQINGHPVSCLINNPFIPWVSDVAETLNIPSAMLWVQSCACFSAYYHYYHNLVPFPTKFDPEINVQLPCMPLLKYDEVPSFLYPTTPYPFLARAILGQYEKLSKPFCILMETFQELENDVVEYMSGLCPIKPVGPLFKSPNTPDSTIRSDFTKPDDCIEWLDSKNPSSVVYISFGSVIDLQQKQADEISKGLLNSGVCFLWVLRNSTIALTDGFLEKVGDKGKVVQWSPQEKVLSHKAIVCFMTHCGWNSSMEALSSGVPLVAFPGWGDQVTNAKYLVDVLKVGVRLSRGEAANEMVSKEDVEKCLREVTGDGEKAFEMRKNALKWKKAAEEAVAEGGSSERSLQSFVDEIRNRSVRVATSEFNNI